MPEIQREFNNFLTGELTYHEAIEGGEYTAQHMVNLRADTDGALRQRHGIFARGHPVPSIVSITGLAASENHLLFIRSDGQLFYRPKQRPERHVFINITGRGRDANGIKLPTQLAGRLSLIHDFGNEFYLITSEGEDQGLWIDVRDETNIEAHQLGFNPPTFQAVAIPQSSLTQYYDPTSLHFYRFTYLRDEPKEPFGEMESNPSEPMVADLEGGALDGGYFRLDNLAYNNDDGLETGIGIYRSRPIDKRNFAQQNVDINDPDLDYRRIGIFKFRNRAAPINTNPETLVTAFDDFMNEETRQEQEPLRFDNNRMPKTVKSFTLYNDLIFAPNGEELRYSDLRFEGLTLWAFPENNSIRRPVDTQFATAYRDMLIWGGRNGTWRLTGGTEYRFQVDRISNLGAVDGYAITTTEDVVGYITPAGMHFTDGISTTKLSDPLKAHFENHEVVRGAVAFLPNGDTLWSIVFLRLDGTLNRITWMRSQQWQQWADIEMEQSTRFNAIEITGDKISQVIIAENAHFMREILWDNVTQTRDGRTLEDRDFIKWAWKSQRLDWASQGISKDRKRFKELVIIGKADSQIETPDGTIQAPVDAIFTIHDAAGNTTEHTEQVTLNRPFLYPVRIPINRRGIAIEFEIKGQGNCDIRGLCIKGSV